MSNLSRGDGYKKVTATQAGTTTGVTATIAAAAGARTIITHVSGSGDAAAVVTIEIPTGTVVWRKRYAAAFTFSENFQFGEYEDVAGGQAVSVKISASTAASEANIAGVQPAI
jgi:hypothetical protein